MKPLPLSRLPVTSARVFAIAGPAMLANLTTPLLGIVGTAAIGRLGEAHLLGGIAMSALVFDGVFWLFAFLRMGTVALTAQALGAGDAAEQRAVLLRALLIAALVGVLLIALQAPLASAIYRALGGSDAVRAAAESYFFVRVWSAPCALANFAVLGWLVGIARAGTALVLQIAINVVNMTATVLLVLVLDYGIAGAALAAVLAETSGLVLGLGIAWLLAGRRFDGATGVLLRRDKLVRMVAINRDIMIRTAAIISAFAFFTAQGARAGDVALAANAVLHNFILIGSFFLDGFATAAEQLCGRAVGANDGLGFVEATRRILAWGFLFGAATTVFFLIVGGPLIDVMTTSDAVRETARQFMLFAALAPALGVAAYAFDGIYIGATWARDMRNLMLAALAIYLATWWALRPYGNSGLWIALLTFLAARGLLQAARYPRLRSATFPKRDSKCAGAS
jgi:multidrug resistance protein, MATE family